MLLVLQANQVQSAVSEEATEEVVTEEAVTTKYVSGKLDTSTAQNTHH